MRKETFIPDKMLQTVEVAIMRRFFVKAEATLFI